MAEQPAAPVARRSGVVDLWRSTRTMQVWQQAEIAGYVMREIGADVSVRVHHQGAEVFRFDADRSWWDEHLRTGDGKPVACGAFSIPADVLTALLVELDAARPELTGKASRQAALTQARIEREASESGQGEPLHFSA